MTVSCFFCGEPLDPTSSMVWHGIHGWERKALDHMLIGVIIVALAGLAVFCLGIMQGA